MDSQVLRECLPYFLKGALVMVRVATVGVAASLTIGLVCAIIRYLDVPAAKRAVGLYTEFSCSTLFIVQLSFIYHGLPKADIVLSSEASAITGLNFLEGEYMAEAFRSGFDSIGTIQWESAQSLDVAYVNVIVYVIVLQALSRSVAALAASVIFSAKGMFVIFVVVFNDLVCVVREKIGNNYDTAEALFPLVTFYIAIILPASLTDAYLEKGACRAEFGN